MTRISKASGGNVGVFSALLIIVLLRIFMELIMSHKILMLGMLMVAGVASEESKTAVKVVLGEEWFTSTTTGEANGQILTVWFG